MTNLGNDLSKPEWLNIGVLGTDKDANNSYNVDVLHVDIVMLPNQGI